MISCRVDFNYLYDEGRIARLDVGGVGSFPVFSGLGNLANKPESSYMTNATVPPGSYWIVDRPEGGFSPTLKPGSNTHSQVITITTGLRCLERTGL